MLVKVIDKSRKDYNYIGKFNNSNYELWMSKNGYMKFTHAPYIRYGININQIIKATQQEEFLYYIHGSKCLRED